MGICSSTKNAATAKLILQEGGLKEFSNPVKVSKVLGENPTSFICNSDDMDFDKLLSAVKEDEELQLGELYFALPLTWLNCQLSAEEMAALAVKASLALRHIGSGEKCFFGCGICKMDGQLMFSGKLVDECSHEMLITCSGGGSHDSCDDGSVVMKRKEIRKGRGRGSPFTTALSVILEE